MQPDFPVIHTKILIPRRRNEILSRPRLLAILENVLDLKLFILAAPAGYGKTTLLVDFSHQTAAPVCWYALDTLDRDPKRFIAHFIASIQHKYPAFGKMALAALAELNQDKMNLDPVITAIVNDAYQHITSHFVFVLDDFHLVRDSKPTEQFVNRIIQEFAENCHFIIASRTLLTLPDLTLLVARSQVDGLSFEELAFLPEELKKLMADNYQQTLSNDKAEEMISNSEGWITGLLLTTQLSPKGLIDSRRIEKVSGVDVYEYLTQQVFDRQSKLMQSFLLRTSLLEEFDADLCRVIIGRALGVEGQNWKEVINRIQRDNLFVLPVGDETLFLRYHHLFRDFLQKRMHIERPEETSRIETELAQYYENTREWERAINIYSRIGTAGQMVECVRKAAPSMILSGSLVTLTDWLNALPGGLADKKPELLSIRGSIAMLRGEYKSSLELLDRSIHGLRESGSEEELATALIRRSAINRHLGEYENALNDALDAIKFARPPLGFPQKYAEALRAEGLVYYHTGGLNKAREKLSDSYNRFREMGMASDAAKVMMDLGVVYDAMGDLDQTEKCFTDSLDYWEDSHNLLWQANLLNNIGVIKHKRSQYEQAVITLEKALSYSRLAVNPRLEGGTLTSLGDLYRDIRAFNEARQAYKQAADVFEKTYDSSLNVYLTLALAVLDRIAGDFPSSQKQISAAIEQSKAGGSQYESNTCLLEQKILELKMGKKGNFEDDFKQLEVYFSTAGYQLEAFKALILKLISEEGQSETELNTEVKRALSPGERGTKYQVLIQIAMEFKESLEKACASMHSHGEVCDLVGEVSQFEKELPALHRVISHHSSSVNFVKPRLIVRGFGKMQVSVGEKIITNKDWQTRTVRDLFFFMLSHPEGATKEEIGEVFWPEASWDKVKLRFKNTIYRLRRAVGIEAVNFSNEIYAINRAIEYDYDVESFQQELESAAGANNDEERVAHLQAAVAHYHGELLPKMDQDWVTIEREKYRQGFMDAVITLMDYCMETKKYPRAIELSQLALQQDCCDEEVHRSAMLVFSAMHDRRAVARQFDKCKLALKKELNLQPSPQTVKLFDSLMGQ